MLICGIVDPAAEPSPYKAIVEQEEQSEKKGRGQDGLWDLGDVPPSHTNLYNLVAMEILSWNGEAQITSNGS